VNVPKIFFLWDRSQFPLQGNQFSGRETSENLPTNLCLSRLSIFIDRHIEFRMQEYIFILFFMLIFDILPFSFQFRFKKIEAGKFPDSSPF
jgi:hypothetical protein